MAKRFIDTGFYKSPFVRGLKGSLKGLYVFIFCDCSGAGIWSVDFKIASLYTGFKITEEEAQVFIQNGKAIDLKNGKWFFPDFIEHQYPNGLQYGNKAHQNFIIELKKYNLIDENLKGLRSPLEGAKVMVEEMVKEKEKEKGKKMSEIFYPYNSGKFLKQWNIWKAYKEDQFNFKYKGTHSEQAALMKLGEESSSEEEAIKMIHEAISNGWKGIFKLKLNGRQTGSTKNLSQDAIARGIDKVINR